MRLTLSAVLVLLAVAYSQAADPPKLAVLIVVDQMRADYVDRFQGDWSAGLKRLISNGAWFSRAAYPYLETVTCAGHATIATGAFPSVHGVIQNTWIDRGRDAMITCTEDATVGAVPYGKPVAGSESAAALMVPSFAEEMRRQKGARVLSLSLKARSAIMMAGHGEAAVAWLSDSLDGWETSTAFSQAAVPEVAAFVSVNHIETDFGRTWERLLPVSRYSDADAGVAEAPPTGWTTTFPHVLKGRPGDSVPSDAYYQQWERSPYADAYLGRMAAALVESMKLGKHDTTDVLAISFSSPDLVGHAFGPRSHENRDMYVHLDRTIGTLLERLDAIVGRDAYVLALTSDHGVTPIPEQSAAEGRDGGRVNLSGVFAAIENAAVKTLGPGRYLGHITANDIYFQAGVFEKLTKNRAAMDAVLKAATSQPGVGPIFRADQLPAATASKNTLTRAAALSYYPGRSGDLMFEPDPGWIVGSTGTSHGSANPDDQRVPIIFFGRGIKPGKYAEAVTPADVVPTLAAICNITLPHAQGTVLRFVLN